jgi:hypothetical protein
MKKIVAIIFGIVVSFCSYGQIDLGTNKLIDNLSWNSITCDHSYHTFIVNYKDSSVQKLIEIGKPAIENLIKSIDKPDKTVIIHMILTKIIEPDLNNDNLPILYIYKDCNNLIGWHHIYNGLVWEWFSETNNSIEDSEVVKIKDYWFDRIHGEYDSKLKDLDLMMTELQKNDKVKYPCIDNRVYQNNSSKIEFGDLEILLNTKYPSSKFNEVFSYLGNDSTYNSFDDCFYISFDTDGLQLLFDIDSTLTTIFFMLSYQGELLNGVTMNDITADIEEKLGKLVPENNNNYSISKGGIDFFLFFNNTKLNDIYIEKE